ncbi:ribonuclease T2 [Apiospora sp. TS-2023a]|jgi:ribonuclease T2
MAPSASLRSILAYAGNLISQVPLQLSDVPNPLAPFLGPTDPTTTSTTTAAVAVGTGNAAGFSPYIPLSGAPTCPIDGPTSCNNQTAADSCCFVHPGGRLLMTQFWDEQTHVSGSETDWTAHGLWPDLCDGSYDQFCGMTPRFNNITAILKEYKQDELLDNMSRYWVANYGTNEHLWEHEYNKHATCINTLAPACYGDDYKPGLEVVDYFVRAFGLFQQLDTYYALEQSGIVPSSSKTFDLEIIQTVLERFSGGRVILKCGGRRHDRLHEAWYVYFVKGSLQSGQFVPASDSFKGDQGNCAKRVKYLPKRRKH